MDSFDFAKFVSRRKLKQREVAAAIGASTGLIGIWATGRSVPSYEKLAKLIELGMTAQEMFGEELGNLLVKNSNPERPADKSEILAAVKEALSATFWKINSNAFLASAFP